MFLLCHVTGNLNCPHCLWLRFLLHIHTTYRTVRNLQQVLLLSQQTWAWQPRSKGSLIRVCERVQQWTMSFSYQAASSGQSQRASLSMQSERVTHLHLETITKTLWIPHRLTKGIIPAVLVGPLATGTKRWQNYRKATLNGHESKRAKQMTMAIILTVVTKAEIIPNVANKQNTTTTTKREK